MIDNLAARVLAAIEEAEGEAPGLHEPWCSSDYREWIDGKPRPSKCSCGRKADILRHCEADKRTVQRHSQIGHQIPFGDYYLDYCASCKQLMPCGDLLDRADAYGVEVVSF